MQQPSCKERQPPVTQSYVAFSTASKLLRSASAALSAALFLLLILICTRHKRQITGAVQPAEGKQIRAAPACRR